MQKILLSIPQPCTENWNKMTPRTQGRYCQSCEKTVIDFTSMTDAQLLNYFSQLKSEKVCGRVLPEQLENQIELPEQPKRKVFTYWKYFLGIFLFMGKGDSSHAQKSKAKNHLTASTKTDREVLITGEMVYVEPILNPIKKITKKLLVVDEDSIPIPFAEALATNSGVRFSADEHGVFELSKIEKSDILTIQGMGYKSITIGVEALTPTISLQRNIPVLDTVKVIAYDTERSLTAIAGGLLICRVKGLSIRDTIQNILPSFQSYRHYFS